MGLSNRMLKARSLCAPASLRYATYSANPMGKRGTIDDLIHNDALVRGHGAARLSSGWKVDRSAAASNEAFPLPDHRYVYQGQVLPGMTATKRRRGSLGRSVHSVRRNFATLRRKAESAQVETFDRRGSVYATRVAHSQYQTR